MVLEYYNLDREILQCTTIGRPTRSTSFLAAKIFNILSILKLVKEVERKKITEL